MNKERQLYLSLIDTVDKIQIASHRLSLFEKLVLKQSFTDLMKELTDREPGQLSYIGIIVNMMRKTNWTWRGKKVSFNDHVDLLNKMYEECIRKMNIDQNGYHLMSIGGWTMEVDAYKGTVRVNFNLFDNIIQPESEGYFERDE